jgi:hypothetical protein
VETAEQMRPGFGTIDPSAPCGSGVTMVDDTEEPTDT